MKESNIKILDQLYLLISSIYLYIFKLEIYSEVHVSSLLQTFSGHAFEGKFCAAVFFGKCVSTETIQKT